MRTQERMSLCINACSACIVRLPPACLHVCAPTCLRVCLTCVSACLRGLRVKVSRCVGVQEYAAMDGCSLERLQGGMDACKNAGIQRGVHSRMRADVQTYVCILTMRARLCLLAMCSACAWRLSVYVCMLARLCTPTQQDLDAACMASTGSVSCMANVGSAGSVACMVS